MRKIALFAVCTAGLLLYACSSGVLPPSSTTDQTVAARWDEAERAPLWTDAALEALETHGEPLVKMVPDDIARYCPDYAQATEAERKAFWVNLIASLSFHESTWRPQVSGGDGQWHGLLQIAPATARGYGCVAGNAADLRVGALNVSCAIRIMAETVTRDGVISRGMRGVAADWGPFHQEKKREDIQGYTRELPYCQ